jgi:hypothetical protein
MLDIPQTELHSSLLRTINYGIEQQLMLHNTEYPVHNTLTRNPLAFVNLFKLALNFVQLLEFD